MSGELAVYCPTCNVTRAVAHIMGAHYLLEVCGHAVLREGHSK